MIKEYRFRNLDYIISYPDGYVEGKRYPIVFHTPGAGARGRNLALIEKGIALLDRQNEGNEYVSKCLIVIPQCYAQNWFDIYDELRDLCDYIYNAPFTDKHRFYGSGISMGGYAIYQLFMTFCRQVCGGHSLLRRRNVLERRAYKRYSALDFPRHTGRRYFRRRSDSYDRKVTRIRRKG